MKNIQDIVDKHYNQMFKELIEIVDLTLEIINLNGLPVRVLGENEKKTWRKTMNKTKIKAPPNDYNNKDE